MVFEATENLSWHVNGKRANIDSEKKEKKTENSNKEPPRPPKGDPKSLSDRFQTPPRPKKRENRNPKSLQNGFKIAPNRSQIAPKAIYEQKHKKMTL